MTTIATTPGIDPTTTSGATGVLSTKAATAGDNPFLKLLTESLKNQTPLEPVDNASFMNQMASYTTMQEQRDLNSNMLKLLDFQGALARLQGLGQGSALLGKEVTYADADGKVVAAKVDSVFVNESGDVRLKLEGDKEIGLREVIGIAEPHEAGAAQTGTTNPGAAAQEPSLTA
ncbi:MAG TPA: flagellar hook capping FlgD N-terminal domain-containing protein [Planctomycetota bacterium]|nr:flagellar hook capping FlgD N-terminal domain-containing protein [Planctomycetota bacterium]